MKKAAQFTEPVHELPLLTSKEAATLFGITNDYVTQLCRRGKVEGRLAGRLWYVEESSLCAYLDLTRSARGSYRKELAKSMREKYHAHQLTPPTMELPSASMPETVPSISRAPLFPRRTMAVAVALAIGTCGAAATLDTIAPTHLAVSSGNVAAAGILASTWSGWSERLPSELFPLAKIAMATTPTATASKSAGVPHAVGQKSVKMKTLVQIPASAAKMPLAIVPTSTESAFVSEALLQTQLANFGDALRSDIARMIPSPAAYGSPSAQTIPVAAFAQSQRINTLSDVTISNATVNGFSGLTDADIPNDITASNYLPLTGGALTGDLSINGSLSAGSFAASSTSYDDLVATNATSTNLYVDLFSAEGATTTDLFASIASTTDLFATIANIANATIDALSLPNGFLSLASSTIGNGTSAGGLTVFGSATTTGNAYFGGKVGIGTTPTYPLDVFGAGNFADTARASYFVATSSTASELPYASSTAFSTSGTGYFGLGQFTNTAGTTTIASGQGFTIGGSQFLVQQGSGRVGIGTVKPGSLLEVQGTVSGQNFSATSTSATSTFSGSVVLASGGKNVGIGTTNPTGLFTVFGNAQNTPVNVDLINNAFTGTGNAVTLRFQSYTGLGAPANGAYISNLETDSASGHNVLAFGDRGSELMRLDQGGNVGIGTTNPGSKLEVQGAVAAQNFSATSTTATSTLLAAVGVGTSSPEAKFAVENNTPANTFYFADTYGGGNESLAMDNVGNLLFDATTPLADFTLGGSLYVDLDTQLHGALNVDGILTQTGLANFTGGFLSQASSTVVGNFTSTGIGTFARGVFSDTSGTTTIASGQGFTIGSSQFVLQQGSGHVGVDTTNVSRGLLNIGAPPVPGTFALSGTVDSGGRGIEIISQDFVPNTTGSKLNITLGSATGNTYSGLQAYNSGASATGNLALQGAGGNIGIGTTSPLTKLSVQGTAGANDILNIASSTGVSLFYVNASGDVGIGTMSPNANFHLYGATVSALLGDDTTGSSLKLWGSTASGAYIQAGGSGSDSNAILNITRRDNTSADISQLNVKADTSYFAGLVGIGTTSPSGAGLDVWSTQNGTSVTGPTPLLVLSNPSTVGSNVSAIAFKAADSSGDIKTDNYFGIQTYNQLVGNLTSDFFWTTRNGSNGTIAERMRLTGAGNLGVGTSSPLTKLSIQGTAGANDVLNVASSTGASLLYVNAAGSVGIGTASPSAKLEVSGNIVTTGASTNLFKGSNFVSNSGGALSNFGASDGGFYFVPSGNGAMSFVTGGADHMRLDSSGRLGIGTTSPSFLLGVGNNTVSGTIAQFENSTGSCFINPNNAFTGCTSDLRLKTNIVPLDSELASVMALNPVTYTWISDASSTPHFGFIAQEVQKIFPDLVMQGPDGYYALNYAGFAPYLTRAIQEIASISGQFKDNLVAWLGNEENGIHDLYASVVHTKEVHAQELCAQTSSGQDVCVTGDQLAALLAGQTASAATVTNASNDVSATEESSAPTIAMNGNNPAEIVVGANYQDLGATIVGPSVADTQLSIHTFVDGVEEGEVLIDTSAAGTHTIEYVAINSFGAATSSRSVIVSATGSPQVDDATTSDAIATDPAVEDPLQQSASASSTDQIVDATSTTQN